MKKPFFIIHTEFQNSKEAIDFFARKNLGQWQNNKKAAASFNFNRDDDDEIALTLCYVNARSLNFQFVRESSMETESETHGRKGEKSREVGLIFILIHSFFCQILGLNVSCCSIGTVSNVDNGNNSFHQMVIFSGWTFTKKTQGFLRTLALV